MTDQVQRDGSLVFRVLMLTFWPWTTVMTAGWQRQPCTHMQIKLLAIYRAWHILDVKHSPHS